MRSIIYKRILISLVFAILLPCQSATADHKSPLLKHKRHLPQLFEYRSIDGTGNNQHYPEYGSTEIPLERKTKPDYDDGMNMPAGGHRKSPREISNIVAEQTESMPNSKGASDMLWQWGQFVDHDIDLTPDASHEYFPVQVPAGDHWFDPYWTGQVVIPLLRSLYIGGSNLQDPRQQVNVITAFIDGSNVYGSDDLRAAALRTFEYGKLKTSHEGKLLPYNMEGLPNAGGPSADLFLAGDIRANEQIGLIAMHTLFVREHNRLCERLHQHFPDWDDEKLYQVARKMVGAQIQVITYQEFLPIILGKKWGSHYRGYNKHLNPGILNEFSTAAYRFGHTMLPNDLLIVDPDSYEHASLSLADAFFNPELISDLDGIEGILLGLMKQPAQEVDTKVVDSIRNFLFGPPGAGGLDLASLNIQRGRDHGLPSYNQTRRAFGLKPVKRFRDITSDKQLRKQLKQAYGHVKYIDLWVGGLAEDHVRGAMVGETFHTIISHQFKLLRDGDRFWYENDPFFKRYPWLKYYIQHTRLSDVIKRNTHLDKQVPRDVFKVH